MHPDKSIVTTTLLHSYQFGVRRSLSVELHQSSPPQVLLFFEVVGFVSSSCAHFLPSCEEVCLLDSFVMAPALAFSNCRQCSSCHIQTTNFFFLFFGLYICEQYTKWLGCHSFLRTHLFVECILKMQYGKSQNQCQQEDQARVCEWFMVSQHFRERRLIVGPPRCGTKCRISQPEILARVRTQFGGLLMATQNSTTVNNANTPFFLLMCNVSFYSHNLTHAQIVYIPYMLQKKSCCKHSVNCCIPYSTTSNCT